MRFDAGPTPTRIDLRCFGCFAPRAKISEPLRLGELLLDDGEVRALLRVFLQI